MSKSKKSSSKKKQEPIEVEAFAAPVSSSNNISVDTGVTGGLSININVNSPTAKAGALSNAGAAPSIGGGIVEVARSPTHKKRRGNKDGKENTETEYTVKGGIDEAAGRALMTKHNWPPGLQQALIKTCTQMPIRFFITDDSGSMLTNDGHRYVNM